MSSHKEELTRNNYTVLEGSALKDLKKSSLTDINVGQPTRALGIFTFQSVLNLAMLLTESESAQLICSRMLDIVLTVLTKRAGGHIQHINQRGEDYLPSAFQEKKYRKKFMNTIDRYIEMPKQWKYGASFEQHSS